MKILPILIFTLFTTIGVSQVQSWFPNMLPLPKDMAYTNLSNTPVNITKLASGVVTPNTGNGYSINISSLGLTNLVGYAITPVKNTTDATNVPKVAIKSASTTSIVVNIIQGNSTTVNLLGSLVLLGVSEQFADVSGLTLNVIVWGN